MPRFLYWLIIGVSVVIRLRDISRADDGRKIRWKM